MAHQAPTTPQELIDLLKDPTSNAFKKQAAIDNFNLSLLNEAQRKVLTDLQKNLFQQLEKEKAQLLATEQARYLKAEEVYNVSLADYFKQYASQPPFLATIDYRNVVDSWNLYKEFDELFKNFDKTVNNIIELQNTLLANTAKISSLDEAIKSLEEKSTAEKSSLDTKINLIKQQTEAKISALDREIKLYDEAFSSDSVELDFEKQIDEVQVVEEQTDQVQVVEQEVVQIQDIQLESHPQSPQLNPVWAQEAAQKIKEREEKIEQARQLEQQRQIERQILQDKRRTILDDAKDDIARMQRYQDQSDREDNRKLVELRAQRDQLELERKELVKNLEKETRALFQQQSEMEYKFFRHRRVDSLDVCMEDVFKAKVEVCRAKLNMLNHNLESLVRDTRNIESLKNQTGRFVFAEVEKIMADTNAKLVKLEQSVSTKDVPDSDLDTRARKRF